MIVIEMQMKPCMKLPLVSHCLGARGGANGFLIRDHLPARDRGQAKGAALLCGACAVGALLPVGLELGSARPWCCLQALSVLR